MTAARTADAGFTLIETLVALAVLAMTSVGLLAATEAHISRVAALEMRAAALWAAENHLAEIALGLQPATQPPAMLGIAFDIAVQAETTTDPDLQRLIITATEAQTGRSLARLTGFVLADITDVTE
jgi:general secretion pathway protein I